MLILFGYMDALIFLKWNINYKGKEYRAPDIKAFLMNIFLRFGELPETGIEGEDWIFFSDRATLEKVHFYILIVSLMCIIIMLIPKMIINYCKSKHIPKKSNIIEDFSVGIINDSEDADMEEKLNIKGDNIVNNENNRENQIKEEVKFSDFFVASVIETIEFVLGTVSNTASYLRLWALSLAHSQLSAVFFAKSLKSMGSISQSAIINGILLSIVYVLFASVTFFVLLLMDLMECALHTLRLHWVEFQNKFYKADGYKFKPFCFRQELNLNILEGYIR
jgi:V-type H+-transporting ATPase subunit a